MRDNIPQALLSKQSALGLTKFQEDGAAHSHAQVTT